jgi:hypothetical protein
LGFWREAERDADLVDALQGFFDLCLGDGEGFGAGVEFFLTDGTGFDERNGAIVAGLGFG